MRKRLLQYLCAAFGSTAAAAVDDPFSQHVRPTEPLTPQEELAALHPPPGFKIQLFASEPQINKPMNMAFDTRGRLWVTNTLEYPFPVPLDKAGRDSIKILADTDGDGAADRVSTFVDGLNIPTGVLPYRSGCIAWSIPNIWLFDDTDGDGKCDVRKKLYGPFGWERDTHGMNSSFRMGLDGWVYATHGFNNHSTVAGTDGHKVTMQSGHVYRFRPDGSRIEIYTHGQVNPFGLCFDLRGNLYSADCHSWPITQLIKGAYYPSFGKPHDGLGFGPRMIQHTHDSTGLCGIVYLEDDAWPAGFKDNTLLGDVLNCRVRRDRITFTGSSPKANKQDDFIRSDDPWFRPVDLQYGPDGALYIADFYNKIIGHYEVPLDHPGRDRERGRIWRVAPEEREATLHQFDLTKWSPDDLLTAVDSNNTGLVTHATTLLNRAEISLAPLPKVAAHSHRAKALFAHFPVEQNSPRTGVRTNEQRETAALITLREMQLLPDWKADITSMVLKSLADPNPHVVRAAAGSQSTHPSAGGAVALAEALKTCPPEDTHLRHAIRISLRNHLAAGIELAPADLDSNVSAEIAEFAASSGSPTGAAFVLKHLRRHDKSKAATWLPLIASGLPSEHRTEFAKIAIAELADHPDLQLEILLRLSGDAAPPELRAWAADITNRTLAGESASGWQRLPHPDRQPSRSPWFLQRRTSQDGEEANFACSLPPGGEALTGVLRYQTLAVPAQLSFFIAGHDGFPDKPPGGKNFIRLLDAENGSELARSAPPRNDTAQAVSWDLQTHVGKRGIIEIVDGDTGSAYAWLAVGRFSHPSLSIPELKAGGESHDRAAAAAQLAARFDLTETKPALLAILSAHEVPASARSAAATALAAFANDAVLAAAAPLLAKPLPEPLARRITAAFAETDPELAKALFLTAGPTVRRAFAEALAGSLAGAHILVDLAPPTELLAPPVKARLVGYENTELARKIASATSGVPTPDARLDALVADRITTFATSSPDRAWGGRVFVRHCAICHQLGGKGKVIGPQLDGIHTRGAARLIEDIIAPNRHVDPNFRMNVVRKNDGSVFTGMPRGETEAALQLIDIVGKMTTIPVADIKDRQETSVSLMPAQFGESLSKEDFSALVGFLLRSP